MPNLFNFPPNFNPAFPRGQPDLAMPVFPNNHLSYEPCSSCGGKTYVAKGTVKADQDLETDYWGSFANFLSPPGGIVKTWLCIVLAER